MEDSALLHLLAILCSFAVTSGQILFKISALRLSGGQGNLLSAIGYATTALAIYGAATIGWIFLLQHLPLNRAYPYMALSFIVVPLASQAIFGEKMAWGDYVGMLFILLGILTGAMWGGR